MLSKKAFSRILVILIVSVVFLHVLAMCFSLYWRFWWADIVMHTLGGMLAGFLAIWFFYYRGEIIIAEHNKFFILLAILGTAALIGVLWEFQEFLCDCFIKKSGLFAHFQLSLADTMSDLFFDLLGGAISGIFFLKCFKKDYGRG